MHVDSHVNSKSIYLGIYEPAKHGQIQASCLSVAVYETMEVLCRLRPAFQGLFPVQFSPSGCCLHADGSMGTSGAAWHPLNSWLLSQGAGTQQQGRPREGFCTVMPGNIPFRAVAVAKEKPQLSCPGALSRKQCIGYN